MWRHRSTVIGGRLCQVITASAPTSPLGKVFDAGKLDQPSRHVRAGRLFGGVEQVGDVGAEGLGDPGEGRVAGSNVVVDGVLELVEVALGDVSVTGELGEAEPDLGAEPVDAVTKRAFAHGCPIVAVGPWCGVGQGSAWAASRTSTLIPDRRSWR